MNKNIREYIANNFEGCSKEELWDAIEGSIRENDELTLPGMGVFLEIIWNNSDDKNKDHLINTLKKGL